MVASNFLIICMYFHAIKYFIAFHFFNGDLAFYYMDVL